MIWLQYMYFPKSDPILSHESQLRTPQDPDDEDYINELILKCIPESNQDPFEDQNKIPFKKRPKIPFLNL